MIRRHGGDRLRIASTPAIPALMAIVATTASPAHRSATFDRNVKAMARGTAVNVSPKLWMRSASSATLPLAMKTTTWIAAAPPNTASDLVTARTPSLSGDGVVDEPVGVPIVRTMSMTIRTLRTAGGLGDRRRSTQRQAEVPVATAVPVAVDSCSVTMEQRIHRRRGSTRCCHRRRHRTRCLRGHEGAPSCSRARRAPPVGPVRRPSSRAARLPPRCLRHGCRSASGSWSASVRERAAAGIADPPPRRGGSKRT